MAFKSRILGLVVIAGLLSACGSVHPGAAAVVAGEPISMEDVDSMAATFCALNVSGQEGTVMLDNAEVRRQAVMSLVVAEVADQVAADRKLDYKVPDVSNPEIEAFREMLKAEQRAGFDLLIEQNQRYSAIVIEIARAANPDVTELEVLLEIGKAELAQEFEKMDVKFDPRFGLDPTGAQISDSGSLSVSSLTEEQRQSVQHAAATTCSSV